VEGITRVLTALFGKPALYRGCGQIGSDDDDDDMTRAIVVIMVITLWMSRLHLVKAEVTSLQVFSLALLTNRAVFI
jgi:hypothetical protein